MTNESGKAQPRFYVDPEVCLAHECCIDLAPRFFEWNDQGYAHVFRQPTTPEDISQCRAVMKECPVCAIHDRDDPKWPEECQEFWSQPEA